MSCSQLFPNELLEAIKTKLFIAYSIVCLVATLFLAGLSDTKVGETHVMVDIGICAFAGNVMHPLGSRIGTDVDFAGGFTVLATSPSSLSSSSKPNSPSNPPPLPPQKHSPPS